MIGWRLASIAGAIAIWWLIALAMPANLLPDPWVSAMTLAKNFAQGDVLPHLAITLARVAGGLAVAMVIGVPVGFALMALRFLVAAALPPPPPDAPLDPDE